MQNYKNYSAWGCCAARCRGGEYWTPAWRDAAPKPRYDVLIVGGGGHGLATAYYLAKNHGVTNVAVLERGWIGGGNTGRNTTIVRSNYLYPESARLYDFSLQALRGPVAGAQLQHHAEPARARYCSRTAGTTSTPWRAGPTPCA